VGKTTLTVNIAAALARKGKRVLLVDSDPQCNLTSYLIEDPVVDDLLEKSDGPEGRTLWTAVRPIAEGAGELRDVGHYETSVPNLALVPGDIRLSEFEALLGAAWAECLQRLSRGFRTTGAISQLVNLLDARNKFDYVFYDPGPNIGPLNRILLLDCDWFIVPVACDLFSVRALKTLGVTLRRWIDDWTLIARIAPDSVRLFRGDPRYLGFIPQGFRVYGQQMTSRYQQFLSRIERNIFRDVISVVQSHERERPKRRGDVGRLGNVRHFSSLIQAAQDQGVPLWKAMQVNDQLAGEAGKVFDTLSSEIVKRIEGV